MRSLMLIAGLAMGVLLVVGNGEAGDISIIQGGQGTPGTLSDPGVVKLEQDASGTTGMISNFGSIQRYQFTSPTGEVQSGTMYRFGSPSGSGPSQVIPIIPGPPMRVAPMFPVIPVVPVLPNAGLSPLVPNIGVITPGPAPGTSTWGTGRR